MTCQPDEEVGLRSAGEIAQDSLFPNGLNQRQIGFVIPAQNGFLIVECPLFARLQYEPIRLDMIFQMPELARHADRHIGLRPDDVESGVREELGLFGRDDKIVRAGSRRELCSSADLDDHCIDVGQTLLAGKTYAMVAVEHKVDVADLINVNRRQIRDR